MSNKECARKCAETIRNGWTTYSYARIDTGRRCRPENETASRFCAVGAMIVNKCDDKIKAEFAELIDSPEITSFNDRRYRTQEQVATVFDILQLDSYDELNNGG